MTARELPGRAVWSVRGAGARPISTALLLGAAPALVVGCLILHLAVADQAVLVAQVLSIVAMLLVAVGAHAWGRAARRRRLVGFAVACLVLLVVPFVGARRPARWLELGAFAVYLAPLLAPSWLLLAVAAGRWGGRWPHAVACGLAALSLLFVCQPDRAQVVAWAVAAAWVLARLPWAARWRALAALPHAVAVAFAVPSADGLAPVAHVELVVALAFQQTAWLGWAAVVAVFVMVGTATVVLSRWSQQAVAVPIYYVSLCSMSVLGWTPAPLLGFGAGPVLGYGLMVGVAAALRSPVESAHLRMGSNDAEP